MLLFVFGSNGGIFWDAGGCDKTALLIIGGGVALGNSGEVASLTPLKGGGNLGLVAFLACALPVTEVPFREWLWCQSSSLFPLLDHHD